MSCTSSTVLVFTARKAQEKLGVVWEKRQVDGLLQTESLMTWLARRTLAWVIVGYGQPSPQVGSPIVEDFLCNCPGRGRVPLLAKASDTWPSKDSGVCWLLLSCTGVLQGNSEQLTRAKNGVGEGRRPCWQCTRRFLISCSRKDIA